MNDETVDYSVQPTDPNTFLVPDMKVGERNRASRRALANKLMEQALGDNQGEMRGRIYVPKSPWVNAVQGFTSGYMGSQVNSEDEAEAKQLQQVRRELLKRMSPTQRDEAQANAAGLKFTPTKPTEGFTLGEGQQRFDPTGKPLASVAPKAEKSAYETTPASVLEYNFAVKEGYKKDYPTWLKEKTAATTRVHVSTGGGTDTGFGGTVTSTLIDPSNDEPVYRHTKSGKLFKYGPDGQPVVYAGLVAPKPPTEKASTEGERTSAGYLGRMEASNNSGAPLSFLKQQAVDRAPNAANLILTSDEQVNRQKQEDWVRAKLRKESGAVIGNEEMAREIRMYFPMAGDSQEVLDAKAQAKLQAEQQMRTTAGHVKSVVVPKGGNKTMPQVGEVRGNHRFKGGNPADKLNWEPVK